MQTQILAPSRAVAAAVLDRPQALPVTAPACRPQAASRRRRAASRARRWRLRCARG